jgi:predicted nuclease with TOPRIM domain
MSFDQEPDSPLEEALEHCRRLTRSNEKLRDKIRELEQEISILRQRYNEAVDQLGGD